MSDWENDVDPASGDDALPPFAALVAALGDIDGADEDEADELAETRARVVDVDRITLTLAIELSIEPAGSSSLRVRGSTPTQWTETSVMPVFHKLTMHIEKAADGEE